MLNMILLQISGWLEPEFYNCLLHDCKLPLESSTAKKTQFKSSQALCTSKCTKREKRVGGTYREDGWTAVSYKVRAVSVAVTNMNPNER